MQAPVIPIVPGVVVLIGVLIGAVTDVRKYRVPNALTLPLLLMGLLYHSLDGTWGGLSGSLLGMLFGFGSLIVFYVMGGIGAGDVKLMAAIGAWLGMPLTYYVFVSSAMAGGVYAVALLLLSGGVSELMLNIQMVWLRFTTIGRHLCSGNRLETELNRTDRRRRVIPYAAMMFVGLIATYIWLTVRSS